MARRQPYSVSEAARVLGLSRSNVNRYVQRGTIGSEPSKTKTGARKHLIPVEEVQRVLAEKKAGKFPARRGAPGRAQVWQEAQEALRAELDGLRVEVAAVRRLLAAVARRVGVDVGRDGAPRATKGQSQARP